jgi:hypothetical protein
VEKSAVSVARPAANRSVSSGVSLSPGWAYPKESFMKGPRIEKELPPSARCQSTSQTYLSRFTVVTVATKVNLSGL